MLLLLFVIFSWCRRCFVASRELQLQLSVALTIAVERIAVYILAIAVAINFRIFETCSIDLRQTTNKAGPRSPHRVGSTSPPTQSRISGSNISLFSGSNSPSLSMSLRDASSTCFNKYRQITVARLLDTAYTGTLTTVPYRYLYWLQVPVRRYRTVP